MMLGEPQASVTQPLHLLCQLDRAPDCAARRFPRAHADQIENRYRQAVGHEGLDCGMGAGDAEEAEGALGPQSLGRTRS